MNKRKKNTHKKKKSPIFIDERENTYKLDPRP